MDGVRRNIAPHTKPRGLLRLRDSKLHTSKHPISRRLGRNSLRECSNRLPRSADMLEIGCGVIRICLLRSRSARCKTIPRSNTWAHSSNNSCGKGYSISPICRRSNNCAC